MNLTCTPCGKEFSRYWTSTEPLNNVFCSRLCSATYNNRAFPKRSVEGLCKTCSTPIHSGRTYCSPECWKKGRKPKRSKEVVAKDSVKAVICFRQRVKLKAVELLGGKCFTCGYSKCVASLDFHHLDPSKKDFQIGGKTISWERIKAEIQKCVLLCSNCHREVHAGVRDIPVYTRPKRSTN